MSAQQHPQIGEQLFRGYGTVPSGWTMRIYNPRTESSAKTHSKSLARLGAETPFEQSVKERTVTTMTQDRNP